MSEAVTGPFVMRRATAADREAVLAVSRAVDPDDYIPFIFDEMMAAAEPAGLYVAELAGQVVAVHALDWLVPDEAYLFAMRVHPAVQGRGIGSAYCQAQVEHAVGLGARRVFLTSVVTNVRAHHVVEKYGFVNRGEWVAYEGLPVGAGVAPAGGTAGCRADAEGAGRARAGRPADLPLLAPFRQGLALSGVIAGPEDPYAIMTARDEDWAVADLAVVEGPGGLDGAMLLRQTRDGQLFIRRLEGTPAAAADLLAYAAAEGARWGLTKLCLSLPARCEPLLAPLGLKPEDAFRVYVFEYTV